MAVNPEVVVRSQSPNRRPASQPPHPPLPPIVERDPADQPDMLGPVAAQPPTSRVPLYIALLLAIVALLSGLIWLVSQR